MRFLIHIHTFIGQPGLVSRIDSCIFAPDIIPVTSDLVNMVKWTIRPDHHRLYLQYLETNMDIKKSLTENRTLLSEAVAVLKLIDHAEDADAITLRTASRAARRLVETVNDQLDMLDIEIGQE